MISLSFDFLFKGPTSDYSKTHCGLRLSVTLMGHIQPQTQIVEGFLTPKTNVLPVHERTWRKPKYILLSERNQSEKITCCMIPMIGNSGVGKTVDSV